MISEIASRYMSPLRLGLFNESLAIRQLTELQRQVPLLYGLLSINAIALSYTHLSLAPIWLTVGALAILLPVCLVRAISWWQLSPELLSPRAALRRLRLTSVLTTGLSIGFLTWALALQPYGGPAERGHVSVFVAITVIGCIFCLTHLPVAALLTTGIVMSIFVIHGLVSNDHVAIAIAMNVTFVTIVMVRVLLNNFSAFVQLATSRDELMARQAETLRLMNENLRLAHTDSLTSLPNRRYFFNQLDASISRSTETGTSFALAIFDLDRFKPINDTFGHVTGDRVLSELGRRLVAISSDEVVIARLGGDEFGLLIPASGSIDEVVSFCDAICRTIAEPVHLADMPLTAGCSGGLSIFPSAGRSAQELFDRSDYALYHSKKSQRGGTTLFTQEHEDVIRAERAIETALQSADLAQEMSIHFQPILDATTDRIVIVEALARWKSPMLGAVPPDKFIAAAERCGTVHALTILLLRKTLREFQQLPASVGLSFNLSSQDVTSTEAAQDVANVILASGVDPRRVTLELTETAIMHDVEVAERTLALLRGLGLQIALDDFGTGYSSLSYVHRLPIDKIKIDRSFTSNIEDKSGRDILATILGLCRTLHLDCIAEGIESRSQFDYLRQAGCRYIQGYLVGAPAPIGETVTRLAAARDWREAG